MKNLETKIFILDSECADFIKEIIEIAARELKKPIRIDCAYQMISHFPRDYDIYMIHYSNVVPYHGESDLIELKKEQLWSYFIGLSFAGAFNDSKEFMEIFNRRFMIVDESNAKDILQDYEEFRSKPTET